MAGYRWRIIPTRHPQEYQKAGLTRLPNKLGGLISCPIMPTGQSLWKLQQDQQRYAEILGGIPTGRRTDPEDEIEIAIFPFFTSPGFKILDRVSK
jgi:hypothetical protein